MLRTMDGSRRPHTVTGAACGFWGVSCTSRPQLHTHPPHPSLPPPATQLAPLLYPCCSYRATAARPSFQYVLKVEEQRA